MRRKLLFSLCLLVLSFRADAQNLVPNPSFETYDYIPDYWDHLDAARPWRKPTYGTSDYLHEDCTDGTVYRAKIPDNAWGWQFARTGKACIALHTWTDDVEEIEFAQVTLLDTMEVGKEYRASVWVNRGDFSQKSTNCHGFLFTEQQFDDYGFIEQTAQIQSLDIIRDTQNWVLVSGTFIADKPYRVLTIGNFCGNSPPFEALDEWGWNATSTYYWDDVSVEPTDRKIDFSTEIIGGCLPAIIRLNAPQFSLSDTWQWQWSDGMQQSGQSVERIFNQRSNSDVVLTITINGQTYTVKKSVKIDIPAPPFADFKLDKDKPAMKKETRFDNKSENASHWYWDFGDGSNSNEENPGHTFLEKGDYHITLIAFNSTGCSDTLNRDIYVACSGKIISNTFTPNDDGSNETFPFDSVAVCGEPIIIQIFNRWGNMVYESEDPYVPWRAEGVTDGTYYYVVRYKGGEEGGYIEVIR